MRLRLAWLALSLSGACAGTETGNPPFEGELVYNTHSSDTTRVAVASLVARDARVPAAEVTIDSAWLVLGDGRFVRQDLCDRREAIEPHVTGLGAGDHAAPGAARSSFELEAADYCGLELPLVRLGAGELPDGAPAELTGRSIVISGVLADGGRFRIESAREDLLFMGGAGTSFAMGPRMARLLVGFDVAVWLDGIELAEADPAADGTRVVSDTANPQLLQAFEANLAAGVALYRDPAGNGDVSSDTERVALTE